MVRLAKVSASFPVVFASDRTRRHILVPVVLLLAAARSLLADEPPYARGDRLMAAYFRGETARVAQRSSAALSAAHLATKEDWIAHRETLLRQLREMLSLDPWPQRTELKPVVTGTLDHPQFRVEKLQFQSRPGLYVTANLYLPKGLDKPAPTVLYLCGHGRVAKGDVSFGNKVHYQHHGVWFARHGYVCMLIDTLQLGEIEGLHHGTYRQNMWWWNDRGYTPAGVEAWNAIRALDYLESRREVDAGRLGVTGRSGGGAYTWWLAALDDRVKVAVPVAGITDLQNHVVDGCVDGHCDCMYLVNTYRWDYGMVAALAAPRPLLLANSDRDAIFPLDGVLRIHAQLRRIYELYGAGDKLGLQISPGPHADTQELQVAAFHWFNHYLKGSEPPIEAAAKPLFQPEKLRVFDKLPEDQINTRIQDSFTQIAAAPAIPADARAFSARREAVVTALREKTFAGWPTDAPPLDVRQAFSRQHAGIELTAYDFTSQEDVRLRLFVVRAVGAPRRERVTAEVLDQAGWRQFVAAARAIAGDELRDEAAALADGASPSAAAFDRLAEQCKNGRELVLIAPRGVGPTATDPDPKEQAQMHRRFMLLGQTFEGMQVWDVRRALLAQASFSEPAPAPRWLRARGPMAGVALYAALAAPQAGGVNTPISSGSEVAGRQSAGPALAGLELIAPPASHRQGPSLLNVLRIVDLPEAVALTAAGVDVILRTAQPADWVYSQEVASRLRWSPERLQVLPLDGSLCGTLPWARRVVGLSSIDMR
jgi:dienelactone hydrolase